MALLSSITAARPASILLVRGGSGITRPFFGATDAQRGAALGDALAAAEDGDAIVLAGGTFDMQSDLMGSPPAVAILGQSTRQTTIKGPQNFSATPFLTITPGMSLVGLSIDTRRAIGIATGTDAELRGVRKLGHGGISTSASFGTVRLYDCNFQVGSHAISVVASGVFECYGCRALCDGGSVDTVSALQSMAAGAVVRFYGGEVIAINGILGTQGMNAAGGGLIECYGTRISASGGTGTPKDVRANSGGTIRLFGCHYDAAKVVIDAGGTFGHGGPVRLRDLNVADPVAADPAGLAGEITFNSNDSSGNAGFFGRTATGWVQLG